MYISRNEINFDLPCHLLTQDQHGPSYFLTISLFDNSLEMQIISGCLIVVFPRCVGRTELLSWSPINDGEEEAELRLTGYQPAGQLSSPSCDHHQPTRSLQISGPGLLSLLDYVLFRTNNTMEAADN